MIDISTHENVKATYIEVVLEARLNSTEKEDTIAKILHRFMEGDVFVDDRFEGKFLVIRNSSFDALQLFGDWVREQRQLDTIRDRLIRSIQDNITALYFNRQAAAMDRLSLIDVNDNPPNGPIILQIISDGLMEIIDIVAPKTYKGSVISHEKWEHIKQQKEREKKRKDRDKLRKEKHRAKYS